jgi:hypothetical protein
MLTYYSDNLSGRDHLGDQGMDGGNIKMNLDKMVYEDVGWIRPIQDMVYGSLL